MIASPTEYDYEESQLVGNKSIQYEGVERYTEHIDYFSSTFIVFSKNNEIIPAEEEEKKNTTRSLTTIKED